MIGRTNALLAASTPVTTGDYECTVYDYDGTILKQEYHNAGDTFTMPSNPTQPRLTFQEWSGSEAITNNAITVSRDFNAGAIYTTTSGNTEFDITLTTVTGLTVTLQNLTGMTSIDWGDGTIDASLTHTYAANGDYTIQVGGVTALGELITSSLYIITDIRISSTVTSMYHSFNNQPLRTITLSNTVNSILAYTFSKAHYLSHVTIPQSVTDWGANMFDDCRLLNTMVLPYLLTDLPTYMFTNCTSLRYAVLPQNLVGIGSYAFNNCRNVEIRQLPSGLSTIGTSAFNGCGSIKELGLPLTLTSIGNSAFYSCSDLKISIIPNSVNSVGNSAFSYCSALGKIIWASSAVNIYANTFNGCWMAEYDFTSCTFVPVLTSTNAISVLGISIIKVPSALYADWIAATNWANYAAYIVAV